MHDEIKRGRHVLFEGAQGTLLDVDHGTYPYVTSSSTLAGGACTGAASARRPITAVIGIAKAYTTRVGGGPFPTELTDALGDRLREAGGEFGATTGRPRRCGWLDVAGAAPGGALERPRRAWRSPSSTCCAACARSRSASATTLDGESARRAADRSRTRSCAPQPVYEELEGWDADTREVRDFDDLPPAAQKYVRRIEELVGVDASLISVGPGRAETIVLKNPFR